MPRLYTLLWAVAFVFAIETLAFPIICVVTSVKNSFLLICEMILYLFSILHF